MGFLDRYRGTHHVAAPDAPATWADLDAAARAEGSQSPECKTRSEEGKRPRAARTGADREARAREVGVVARSEYLTPEVEQQVLAEQLEQARLIRERDRLLVAVPAGWVNPRSRTAWRHGLHSFNLRGTGYHAAAVKAGRFTPGSVVELRREPENPHDPNAIAVYAERARRLSGYVPKAMAKRLAGQMDSGVEFRAISTRGSSAGRDGDTPTILICEAPLMEQLLEGSGT